MVWLNANVWDGVCLCRDDDDRVDHSVNSLWNFNDPRHRYLLLHLRKTILHQGLTIQLTYFSCVKSLSFNNRGSKLVMINRKHWERKPPPGHRFECCRKSYIAPKLLLVSSISVGSPNFVKISQSTYCDLNTFYQRVSIASYASAGIARGGMSVCLSVCPSVCHTPVLYQNEEI